MNTIPVNCYGVAAFVINDDRILLLRRIGPLKGTWCYVAGKIEASEKAWQGARASWGGTGRNERIFECEF